MSPDQCDCAPGYTGTHCQLDLDECSQGPAVHGCGEESVCVNRVGWYYCACRPGYTSYHDTLEGSTMTTCRDVDECEARTATCDLSMTCVNTAGSYRCDCEGSQCSSDCRLEGQSWSDGSEWRDGCNQCRCEGGRLQCQHLQCDCASPHSDQACCPQCQISPHCPHQDIPGLTFSPGQRWVHDCQECECLHGEVDCWPQDCPALSCQTELQPGSCCPSCVDNTTSCPNNTCSHRGQLRLEGQTWTLQHQQACTHCHCKVSHLGPGRREEGGGRWEVSLL